MSSSFIEPEARVVTLSFDVRFDCSRGTLTVSSLLMCMRNANLCPETEVLTTGVVSRYQLCDVDHVKASVTSGVGTRIVITGNTGTLLE
jgi:hypothetical protein